MDARLNEILEAIKIDPRTAISPKDAVAMIDACVVEHMQVPKVVMDAAAKELGLGLPPGWTLYLEDYFGRVRTWVKAP